MASTARTSRVDAGQQITADNSTWFLALGVACIALGIVALGSTVLFAVVSIVVLGTLLVVAGVFTLASAFRAGTIAGTILELILTAMLLGTGLWLLMQPLAGLLAITGHIASYLMLVGIVRGAFALVDRGPGWVWQAIGGLVSVLLGVLVWLGWPMTGLVAVGLFIGVDLIVSGVTWVVRALAARRPHTAVVTELTHEPTP
jgi:uncharacterized membrane protein HdeD (DUF308 family)